MNQQNNLDTKIKKSSWKPIFKEVFDYYNEGKISSLAICLYFFLLMKSDMFGKTYTSTSKLRELSKVIRGETLSASAVNKALKSLRDLNLLTYKRSKGGGKFAIRFSNIFLENKRLTVVDNNAPIPYYTVLLTEVDFSNSPLIPMHEGQTPNVTIENEPIEQVKTSSSVSDDFSSINKDKEKQNDINIQNRTNLEPRKKKFALTKYFLTGNDPEKKRLKDIAEYIGEQNMDYILDAHKTYGMEIIEDTFKEVTKVEEKKEIENLAGYFRNALKNNIEQLLGEEI